jgi:Uma2 family endonuclease
MTLLVDSRPLRQRKRWTKGEYNDLVGRGAFEGQRVYLYRGELIQMASMGALHAFGISNVDEWFHDTFRPRYRLRIQLPFETPGESMPEPDCAVVTHEQMARLPHPNRAELIIEVSDSSVEEDREIAFEYAAALVPDYWILNMRDRQIEMHREPISDPSAVLGYRYAFHRVFLENDFVSPLIRPDVSLRVAAFLKTA